MRYLGEILAFFFMFVFVVLLTPTLVQKTSSVAGFGVEAVLLPYVPWIFLGSLIGLFGIIIAKRRD